MWRFSWTCSTCPLSTATRGWPSSKSFTGFAPTATWCGRAASGVRRRRKRTPPPWRSWRSGASVPPSST
uniref:Putative secreted protein n=1 Tax=Ixodes ricinus TaxID=34613 RepID=A0A6B0U0W4_IXORI